jgi:hypothetical protein
VVDSTKGSVSRRLERDARAACGAVPVAFLYYDEHQARVSESIRLPYVFSWLSWSIGLGSCKTRDALLHDYDALILDDALIDRYETFKDSGAFIQGIAWYKENGFVEADRLATTFEAFLDVERLRRFDPIDLFNQVGRVGRRSCDFDTLLELQAKRLEPRDRAIVPMGQTSLMHPSQMIHQYTMSRRHPARADNCYSLPMIPFFDWLSGDEGALDRATEALLARQGRRVRLFGDEVEVNFALLQKSHIDWEIKQMVQVCVARRVVPAKGLVAYGQALYGLLDVGADAIFSGDLTPLQVDWIKQAGWR